MTTDERTERERREAMTFTEAWALVRSVALRGRVTVELRHAVSTMDRALTSAPSGVVEGDAYREARELLTAAIAVRHAVGHPRAQDRADDLLRRLAARAEGEAESALHTLELAARGNDEAQRRSVRECAEDLRRQLREARATLKAKHSDVIHEAQQEGRASDDYVLGATDMMRRMFVALAAHPDTEGETKPAPAPSDGPSVDDWSGESPRP